MLPKAKLFFALSMMTSVFASLPANANVVAPMKGHIQIQGDANDYITRGKSFDFTDSNSVITAKVSDNFRILILISTKDHPGYGDLGSVVIGGTPWNFMKVGHYKAVDGGTGFKQTYSDETQKNGEFIPDSATISNVLDLSVGSSTCGNSTGAFVVESVDFDYSIDPNVGSTKPVSLKSLKVSFTHRCDALSGSTSGTVEISR